MRISDWSSDVCSSDLFPTSKPIWRRLLFSSDAKKSSVYLKPGDSVSEQRSGARLIWSHRASRNAVAWERGRLIAENEPRSEEHTSELQSLMRISSAVFYLKQKIRNTNNYRPIHTENII